MIRLHKGRVKTLQSDSYGVKEWGIHIARVWGKVEGRNKGGNGKKIHESEQKKKKGDGEIFVSIIDG